MCFCTFLSERKQCQGLGCGGGVGVDLGHVTCAQVAAGHWCAGCTPTALETPPLKLNPPKFRRAPECMAALLCAPPAAFLRTAEVHLSWLLQGWPLQGALQRLRRVGGCALLCAGWEAAPFCPQCRFPQILGPWQTSGGCSSLNWVLLLLHLHFDL